MTRVPGAGCESVFVCGGIHAVELGMSDKAGLTAADVGDGGEDIILFLKTKYPYEIFTTVPAPSEDAVRNLSATFGVTPDYAVPVFRW